MKNINIVLFAVLAILLSISVFAAAPTPTVTITRPAASAAGSSFMSAFNFSVEAISTLDIVSLTIQNGTGGNWVPLALSDGTNVSGNWSGFLGFGTLYGGEYFTVNATDNESNSNFTQSIYLVIDAVAPGVSIAQPINGLNTTSALLEVNFTIYDLSNNSNCSLFVYNSTGSLISYTSNESLLNGTLTTMYANLPAIGAYSWNITCYDKVTNSLAPLSQGNSNTSDTRTYTYDDQGPVINSVYLNETDYFYSNDSANNRLTFMINASDVGSAGIKFIEVNFSALNQGVGLVNATSLGNGLYYANITISDVSGLDFQQRNIELVRAYDTAGNAFGGSVSPYTVLLYNMTTFGGDAYGCMQWDTDTTDLSKETDFEHINLVLSPKINVSCMMGLQSQVLPPQAPAYLSEFTKMAYLNFTSVNFTNSATLTALAMLPTYFTLDVKPQNSYGDSRLYINTTGIAALDTNATITIYHLPFSNFPSVLADNPSHYVSGDTLWAQGPGEGNLTLIVTGFSGYNMTDNLAPTNLSYLSPGDGSVINVSNVVFNITLNGTGTQISLAQFNISRSGVSFGLFVYTNETNTANCYNESQGSEIFRCVFNLTLPEKNNYTLTTYARDFGGVLGNQMNTETTKFSVDISAPTLVSNSTSTSTQTVGSTVVLISNWTDGSLDGTFPLSVKLYKNGVIINTTSTINGFVQYVDTLTQSDYPLTSYYFNASDIYSKTTLSSVMNVTVTDASAPVLNDYSFTGNTLIGGQLYIYSNWSELSLSDSNMTCILYVNGAAFNYSNSTASICNFTYTTSSADYPGLSMYIKAQDKFANYNVTTTENPVVNVSCGSTITSNFTLQTDLNCSSGTGLVVGANSITLNGAGHYIYGNATNAGISITNKNLATITNFVFNGLANGVLVAGSSASNTISSNTFTVNLVGLQSDSSASNIIGDNTFTSNTMLAMNGSGQNAWTLTSRNKMTSNNLSVNGAITFNGGVLELVNSYLTFNGTFYNVQGNITSLASQDTNITANISVQLNFTQQNTTILLTLGDNVSASVAVTTQTGLTNAGYNFLKAIDIAADSATASNLSVATINVYYNTTQLTAANIAESTLKMYYYNTTAGAWQVLSPQGVNTTDHYVWANTTHFSLFGLFGTAPSSGGDSSGGSSGGSSSSGVSGVGVAGGSAVFGSNEPEAYLIDTCLNEGQAVSFYIKKQKQTLTLISASQNKLKLNGVEVIIPFLETMTFDVDNNGILDTKIKSTKKVLAKMCYGLYEINEAYKPVAQEKKENATENASETAAEASSNEDVNAAASAQQNAENNQANTNTAAANANGANNANAAQKTDFTKGIVIALVVAAVVALVIYLVVSFRSKDEFARYKKK